MTGSPPPMRGKGSKRIFSHLPSRITPAYAGKSKNVPSKVGTYGGSPPPMRGKAYHPHFHVLLLGITPAYAGKREIRRLDGILAWDHPRLCGEKELQSEQKQAT